MPPCARVHRVNSKTPPQGSEMNSVQTRDQRINDDPSLLAKFEPEHKVRFITATSLFDGHEHQYHAPAAAAKGC